jgi:putative DNA primase/helicase
MSVNSTKNHELRLLQKGLKLMKFVISTGNSRKDKFWKEQTVSWEEFVKRLSRTTVTSETQQEYRQMKKYQQDNMKDVGGFVAGKLKDGRRRKDSVINRSMLTLDMDYADDAEGIAENMELLNFLYKGWSTLPLETQH